MTDAQWQITAEAAVLWSAITYPDRFAGDLVTQLEPDAFISERLRPVFVSIRDMHEAGESIDLVSVVRCLERKQRLDDAGGPAGVAALFDGLYRSADFSTMLQHVRDDYLKRRLQKMQAEGAKGYEDPDDVRRRLDEMRALIDENRERSALLGTSELHDRLQDELLAPTEDRIDLGWISIDEALKGWRRGEVITFVARPKVGKTSFAQNIVANILSKRKDISVVFYSLELPAAQWWLRFCMIYLTIPEWVAERQHKAGHLQWIRGLLPGLRVVDQGRPSIGDITSDLRGRKPEVVVIDHTDFLRKEGRQNDNEADRVRETFVAIKTMAKSLGTRVLVLHQGLRGDADGSLFRPPTARGSSGSEESSDLQLGGWRESSAEDKTVPDPTRLVVGSAFSRRSAPFHTKLRIVPECLRIVDEHNYEATQSLFYENERQFGHRNVAMEVV